MVYSGMGNVISNFAFILCLARTLFCRFNILIKPRKVLYDIVFNPPNLRTSKFSNELPNLGLIEILQGGVIVFIFFIIGILPQSQVGVNRKIK